MAIEAVEVATATVMEVGVASSPVDVATCSALAGSGRMEMATAAALVVAGKRRTPTCRPGTQAGIESSVGSV
jgi:hypothetical protein